MTDQPQYPSYPGPEQPASQPPPPPPGYQPPPPPPGYQPPPVAGQPSSYGQAPPVYGQPPYGQPPQGPGYPAPQRTNGKAMWSMIAGIVSILFCYLGVLIGPVAIILATQGRAELRRSNGTQTGGGMATAGLVTGIIGTIGWLAIDVLVVFAVANDW
jgi:uncharacterized membrane protein